MLRISFGLLILCVLLALDLRKNGRNSIRLREYAFLAACVLLACLWCIVWDTVTVRLSPEYFRWGKSIHGDPRNLYPSVLSLALSAAWSIGLVAGVLILIANTARKQNRLPIARLFGYLKYPAVAALLFAALLGGFALWFNFEWQPLPNWPEAIQKRFHLVQSLHLGGYLGGTIGLLFATLAIYRSKI